MLGLFSQVNAKKTYKRRPTHFKLELIYIDDNKKEYSKFNFY